ncbi:MAG TPA: RDD family protein, partial [Candidatus Cybelea sp.]
TQAFADAEAWFVRERSETPPEIALPGEVTVATRDCAGWWRRFAAWGIDAVVVSAIITSFGGSIAPGAHTKEATASVTPGDVEIAAPGIASIRINGKKHAAPAATPSARRSPTVTHEKYDLGPITLSDQGTTVNVGGSSVPLGADAVGEIVAGAIKRLGLSFWFPIYLAVLVIFAGQTFGMMIAGLRVVTTDFRKPSVGRTIVRYLITFALWWLIMPLSLIWRRVLLHDRWTKTRVVKVERVVARATGSLPT